jgi:hypothetical protein
MQASVTAHGDERKPRTTGAEFVILRRLRRFAWSDGIR